MAKTANSDQSCHADKERKQDRMEEAEPRACNGKRKVEKGSDPLQTEIEDNKSLAKRLRAENPNYFHSRERSENIVRIKFLDASCQIDFRPRGNQAILGRGKVNIGLKHPQIYVDHVRRWLNLLEWRPRAEEDHSNTPDNTATHLELLVDFELTSGIRFGDDGPTVLTWAEKARILGYYIKTIARVYTVELDGFKTGFMKALRPILDAASLAPLGAPVLSGYARKPHWSNQSTPSAVATNLWKARQNDIVKSECAAKRRNRSFAHRHNLNLSGYRLGKWLLASNQVKQELQGTNAKRGPEAAKEKSFEKRVKEKNGKTPRCYSCHYVGLQSSSKAFAIPPIKGFRWRRLKAGELICATCHDSWKRDKLIHEENLNLNLSNMRAQASCKGGLGPCSDQTGEGDITGSRPKYTREQKAAPDPYLTVYGSEIQLHGKSRKRGRSPGEEGANSASSSSKPETVGTDPTSLQPRRRNWQGADSQSARSSHEAATVSVHTAELATNRANKESNRPTESCKTNSG